MENLSQVMPARISAAAAGSLMEASSVREGHLKQPVTAAGQPPRDVGAPVALIVGQVRQGAVVAAGLYEGLERPNCQNGTRITNCWGSPPAGAAPNQQLGSRHSWLPILSLRCLAQVLS